ncbi:MAG: hypothetical protein JWM98_1938 [Thermoleophilia bacterium]|nr:hypothetical protein [Thermoleophilia bacterium]
MRWWDGAAWTEHRSDPPAAAPQAAAVAPVPAAVTPAHAQAQAMAPAEAMVTGTEAEVAPVAAARAGGDVGTRVRELLGQRVVQLVLVAVVLAIAAAVFLTRGEDPATTTPDPAPASTPPVVVTPPGGGAASTSSDAKITVKQAVNAIEACAASNVTGLYTGCTAAKISVEEPELAGALKRGCAVDGGLCTKLAPKADGYTVSSSIAAAGGKRVRFTETHDGTGLVTKVCAPKLAKVCSGTW